MNSAAEQKAFTRQYILGHVAKCGETAEDYFKHWLPYRFEVSKSDVSAAIKALIRSKRLVVSKVEIFDFKKARYLVTV